MIQFQRKFSERLVAGMPLAIFLGVSWLGQSASGQMIYEEGFNTDRDGVRYELAGRGYTDADAAGVGPGMWEHNFLSPRIGLVSKAPAKRAALLWSAIEPENVFSDDAYQIWDSLASWMVDNKPQARIGFYPSTMPPTVVSIADRLKAKGHTIVEVPDAGSIPSDLNLLIHTNELGDPTNPTVFANLPFAYLSMDADLHDDSNVAGLGPHVQFQEDVLIDVVTANQDHPALGGKKGRFNWTVSPPVQPLEGIGKVPPGGKVLFTYENPATGDDAPGLVVIDKGDFLLGAFSAKPEGTGFIVGGDLNSDFGGGLIPRTMTIGPINVSAFNDLKLTVALAGTDADFESNDFLRIFVDPNQSGDFIQLDEFLGNANKALQNAAGTELRPDRFQDVTYNLPDSATNLVIRFETFSTFPNEVMAIDHVRVYSGQLQAPGDFNGDGALAADDIDAICTAIRSGGTDKRYDVNGDGSVTLADQLAWLKTIKKTWVGDADLNGVFNSGDFVKVFATGEYEDATALNSGWADGDWNCDGDFNSSDFVAAFQDGGYERGPLAASASVPEPTWGIMAWVGLWPWFAARRHRARS